ncbi:MAG: helix-turn-helix transcriptional regulator [Deltaproteobacteria bacterium]|nr:helix-turn-helix transcriptional regulator [Deltaproteobacteria bacterium]
MLRVPEDLEAQFGEHTVRVPEACVIDYQAVDTVVATPALVTRPTFVLVRAGTKQLQPHGGRQVLTAAAGSVVAMRSGTHMMSEFDGQDAGYRSLIVSVDRGFLGVVVGVSPAAAKGPRVVVSTPSMHVRCLFEALPAALANGLADIERQFKLRELLVAMIGDPAVRQLVFREVADWGTTTEDRIVSVMTTHGLTALQVPDLAELCAMSLSSFKRHFQSVYGTTPGKWLTKIRLDHARAMVVGGDVAVSEIGRACGYRDASAFIRAFRRRFGATPQSLRQCG